MQGKVTGDADAEGLRGKGTRCVMRVPADVSQSSGRNWLERKTEEPSVQVLDEG